MPSKDNIINLLNQKKHLRPFIFVRGFLLTDKIMNESSYPFYNLWKHYSLENYQFYIHPEQKFHFVQADDIVIFMIGHAYNPFTMQIDEEEILHAIANDYSNRYRILNELTGIFTVGWIKQNKLTLASDCAGMQIAYYGNIQKHLYVSTHMQLIGDLCNLEPSKYVSKLVSYRFYNYYGAFLPGDLSSYDEVKRIVPNITVEYSDGKFNLSRFYPTAPLKMCTTEQEYNVRIDQICNILQKNMQLIAMKWKNPAISLSGGMDSKGSLAAANGHYDKFQYFSYISMHGEKIDADAAHTICNAIGVDHKIDHISINDSDFPDIEGFRLILEHNFGNIGSNNPNDVRKRVYYTMDDHCKFDIEAKSWVSEVGRANYYKKFGLKKMPDRLNPRQMTTMYKLFLHNRKLVRQTDKIFAEYIKKTDFDNIFNYDASDMYLWEFRYGSWGGQVITCEHRFAFDLTVPYNNRLLMELFLTLPLERRISDQAHYDMIRRLNPKIDQTGITITNYNETKSRMYKEKIYYLVHTHIPF